MNNLSNLTVIILTHRTNLNILKNCLSSIDNEVKIKIIENSIEFNNKKEIEKNFCNVSVYCTGSNLGYGSGNNFGLDKVKTNYALILNPDVICDENFFINIKKYLQNDLDFSIIGISYYKNNAYKPAGFFNDKDLNQAKFIKEYNLYEVDWVVGSAMLINLKKFNTKKIFDENFFLFWEETDLCQRIKKNNQKVYMSSDLIINHLGFKSSEIENELEIIKLRNWHYMWSYFYYHKKNYSLLAAYRKSLGRLFRSVLRIIFYTIFFNKKNRAIYAYRFLGLINSMLGKKSNYRI